MAIILDTNVLVYRHDPRDLFKQHRAQTVIREGLRDGSVLLPHQVILEFVSATQKLVLQLDGTRRPLLDRARVAEAAEEYLTLFPILYPDETVLRAALYGHATYRMSWFDAHLWGYAVANGIDTIYSEDFEDGRYYRGVKIVNPFVPPGVVHQVAARYDP